MTASKLLVGIGLVSISCFQTMAQTVIANRTTLDVLLGSNRADEAFESIGISDGAATRSGGTLTSTNWGNDNYVGLIISGITLRSTYPSASQLENWIEWNGNTFLGGVTKNVYSSGSLLLDFWNPTAALGIDLKDYPASRETFIAGIRVYGSDDSTLLYSDNAITLTDPANGVFFGFQFAGGIGVVEFLTVSGADPNDDMPHIFSPKIDNLAFSTIAVPEPTTLSLAVVGIATLLFIRRRD